MSVKRYDIGTFGGMSMESSSDGAYVRHDDYAALEARCAEMAAENAGLKQDTPDLQTMMSALDAFFADQEVPERAMLAAYNILRSAVESPATDAFLAEVRASSVDDVCLKISNAIINCYQDELVGLDMAATICGDFASELRKGVQS